MLLAPVRYHGRVRLPRLLALLLVLALGCGAALLDPCLLGCHEPVQQSAVPPCHAAEAQSGTSIAGTAECGHDHTGLEADTPLESRLTTARHAAQPAVASGATPSTAALRPGTAVVPLPSTALNPPVPPRPHLRV